MPTPQGLLTASLFVTLAYLGCVSGIAVLSALRAGGRREDAPASDDTLAASRLTMPVSIVVPAGRSADVSRLVDALLDLSYPEFEVIVVADAPLVSADALSAEWQLESREFFFRRTLDTASVRRILRSVRDARLMVVEKDADVRADAINCGVNLARYRYVAVIPPGVTFDRSALLRAMAPALQDPASIVGVGSQVERVPGPGEAFERRARIRRLRSLRALMSGRLFWSRLRRAIGPDDGVFIWRRDSVLQANGFRRTARDADVDMMSRLQDSTGADARRFVRNADPFGHAATGSVDEAGPGRGRWRTAVHLLANWAPASTSQTLGLQTVACVLEPALITPLAQMWLVAGTATGAALGWYPWSVVLLSLLLLSFGTGVVTAAALLLRGAYPGAPDRRELRALLLLSPVEFLLHRSHQTVSWAVSPSRNTADLPARSR